MIPSRIKLLRENKHNREPIKRIILQDYLAEIGLTEEDDKYLRIRQIMRIWGYERYYEHMLLILKWKIEHNPAYNILVCYDTGAFDEDMQRQKLLRWDLYDEKNKTFVMVGGILFQNGEMSFHT